MNVIATAVQVLEDLKSAIKQLSPTQYSQQIPLLYNASVGQHSRHIIEFFQCLEAQLSNGAICYDLRLRQLQIEQSPEVAIEAIGATLGWLRSTPTDCTLQLWVNHELDKDDEHNQIASSLIRELVFNVEHAIHHMAIIKIGLKLQSPEVELPEHFGVAPSTIRYHKHQMVVK